METLGWYRYQGTTDCTGIGIEMEKMRHATNTEADRLSEYHKYEDGTIDQPFLTPDSVKDD